MLHCMLCRVGSFSEANKMPLESLAKIFGPTLVGHASAKPDPSVQWKDAEKQPKVCAHSTFNPYCTCIVQPMLYGYNCVVKGNVFVQ